MTVGEISILVCTAFFCVILMVFIIGFGNYFLREVEKKIESLKHKKSQSEDCDLKKS